MGVEIKRPPVSPQPRTHLAWQGFQVAREHGKGNDDSHRVLEAFFVHGLDVGSIDVLAQLAPGPLSHPLVPSRATLPVGVIGPDLAAP